jgi:hypothetical protein
MDHTQGSTSRPRQWRRTVFVLGVGMLLAAAVAGIVLSRAPNPQGWLWADRHLTVQQLFRENGVNGDDVERYVIIAGLSRGLGDTAKLWRKNLYWKEPATWFQWPESDAHEIVRYHIMPGAFAMASERSVNQGFLLIWTQRGQPDPRRPDCEGCTYETYFLADFKALPGGSVGSLLADNEGSVSFVPEYEHLEWLMTFENKGSLPSKGVAMRVKVRDAKAWVKAAAAIATKEGNWESSERKSEYEYVFQGNAGKSSRLIIMCSESGGWVIVENKRVN